MGLLYVSTSDPFSLDDCEEIIGHYWSLHSGLRSVLYDVLTNVNRSNDDHLNRRQVVEVLMI